MTRNKMKLAKDDVREICSGDINKLCHFFHPSISLSRSFLDKFILSFPWVCLLHSLLSVESKSLKIFSSHISLALTSQHFSSVDSCLLSIYRINHSQRSFSGAEEAEFYVICLSSKDLRLTLVIISSKGFRFIFLGLFSGIYLLLCICMGNQVILSHAHTLFHSSSISYRRCRDHNPHIFISHSMPAYV